MAESIALFLKRGAAPSTDEIQGESSLTAGGREHSIEVLSLSQPLQAAFDRATLQPTGRRFYPPLTFTKRIDKSTPLLRRAIVQNEALNGEFKWYRPNPAGTGTDQHFLTLFVDQARIVKCVTRLPDVLTPATASLPPYEEIELVFHKIRWTYIDGGVEFEDELGSTS